MDLNDELLCAYIDRELDAQALQDVEQALASDPGARLRVERLRAADTQMRKAFPLASAGKGDALAEFILSGPPQAEPAAQHKKAPPRRRQYRALFAAALAAGVAGVVVGHLLPLRGQAPAAFTESKSAIDPVLAAALSNNPSGGTAQATRVLLSFRASNGHYCRVFARPAEEGVACREGSSWQLVVLDRTAGGGTGFHAAGASELVDSAMDRLGGGAALEPGEEQALIAGQWNAPLR